MTTVTAAGSVTRSPRPGRRLLEPADQTVDARLQEIAGHLDDDGQIA